jgi:hypothetical protein
MLGRGTHQGLKLQVVDVAAAVPVKLVEPFLDIGLRQPVLRVKTASSRLTSGAAGHAEHVGRHGLVGKPLTLCFVTFSRPPSVLCKRALSSALSMTPSLQRGIERQDRCCSPASGPMQACPHLGAHPLCGKRNIIRHVPGVYPFRSAFLKRSRRRSTSSDLPSVDVEPQSSKSTGSTSAAMLQHGGDRRQCCGLDTL